MLFINCIIDVEIRGKENVILLSARLNKQTDDQVVGWLCVEKEGKSGEMGVQRHFGECGGDKGVIAVISKCTILW